jgi:hypothetical protein
MEIATKTVSSERWMPLTRLGVQNFMPASSFRCDAGEDAIARKGVTVIVMQLFCHDDVLQNAF